MKAGTPPYATTAPCTAPMAAPSTMPTASATTHVKGRSKPKPNVWLYWIDAEESIDWTWNDERALLGSKAFCKFLVESKVKDRVKAFVLLDLIGDKNIKIDYDGNSNKELQEIVRAAGKAMGEEDRIYRFSSATTDDHEVFRDYGIPSVLLIDFYHRVPFARLKEMDPKAEDRPHPEYAQWWHTPDDTIDKMSAQSLAFAGNLFGLEVKVYMVRASYDQKPYRRMLMETYGAEVVASPSPTTNYGRAVLAATPENPGSLGIAISEAVEDAATRDDTKYSLGSVLNHVLLHQTVIGQEAMLQLEMAGETPDVLVGCTGGGSNFAGFTFPFIGAKLRGEPNTGYRVVAIEPAAAPSLTKGVYAYDFGDTGKLTPLVKMHTLGHDFIPEPIHAGGLRYHGMAPLVSLLKDQRLIEARATQQNATFEAGVQFARTEGILPAPEANHAIRGAIDEALDAKRKGEARVIVFNHCGHGHFDLTAYERYLSGKLEDFEFDTGKVTEALKALPVA